jgi:aspartate dehydrogenase
MSKEMDQSHGRIGIVGLGSIGKSLALALDTGIAGLKLTAVAARDPESATAWLQRLDCPPPVVSIEQMPEHCDLVIECAPSALLPAIMEPVLRAGKKVLVLSVGALLDRPELIELAKSHGGQIIVPTGALLGLDAVTAAAEGRINSVRMVTRKPIEGLLGAPFLVERNIDIGGLTEPLRLFSGSAREGAKGFPANLNVAVALALAGIGPDKTQLEIWADPTVERNTHSIDVDSDSASFTMTIRNIPSENPKTGRITAQSVLSLLRKMSAPVRVGT